MDGGKIVHNEDRRGRHGDKGDKADGSGALPGSKRG